MAAASVLPVLAAAQSDTRRARYWSALQDGAVGCELCPHSCVLGPGQTGHCRVRQNLKGELVTHGYANPCALHVDPIEKKPLYHVLPGTNSYSLAIAGCNFRCLNCQNYTISQLSPLQTRNEHLPPEQAVERAVKAGCRTIAYIYSEPSVWYEYMYDTAKLARCAGLRNLWITAGYLSRAPLEELAGVMDAANIDLKGFDPGMHRKLNFGRLEPVLETLKRAVSLGIWVEVTNLVVPGWTDDLDRIRRMCDWIAANMGVRTPVHFSRFQPMYKLAHLAPTPVATLERARAAAKDAGLRHVYIGNVAGADSDTLCESCGAVVVRRDGYRVVSNQLVGGVCAHCNVATPGIWS